MRVGYIDEQSRQGELELRQVRPGDLVRFMADFKKHGIGKDEIGEVVLVHPEALRVSAQGRKTSGAGLEFGPVEIDVQPVDVVVLVDARDDRISTYRIDASVSVEDLSDWVSAYAALGMPVHRGDLLALETLRRGQYRMARLIRQTPNAAWAEFIRAEGLFVPRAAFQFTAGMVDMEAVRWAMNAMRGPFATAHGRAPTLQNRHDVIWALHEMHQDIIRGIAESDFELAEDESGAFTLTPGGGAPSAEVAEWEAVAGRFEETLATVRTLSDEDWAAEAKRYRTPEEKRVLEHYRDYFRFNPGRPRVAPEEVAKVKYPHLFEEAQAEAEEIWRARAKEMGFHEGPIDRPTPGAHPPGLTSLPGGGQPEPLAPPPEVEVPPGAEPEPRDEDISTDPALAPPLKVAQGKGTHRVRAVPGMLVYHDQGLLKGTLVGFSKTQPDGLVIETEDGQRVVTDSMPIRLSPHWTGRPTIVPAKDVDAWKKARNRRIRYGDAA